MVGGRLWKPLKRGAGGKKVKNHWLKVSKRISSSLTIPTILTRRRSLPLSTFRCTKRMLSQKERVESEVLA